MSNSITKLLDFIEQSPTPFHATQNLCSLFNAAGYEGINENDSWSLKAGGKYYYSRSNSAFVAFTLGKSGADKGFRLLGTHTDSPCLKVKPNPELHSKGYMRLGVEVYGGVLLNPWFDRDLSLAGKVSGLDANGNLLSVLVNFKDAIATVPSLAIHLNREANNNKTVNPQKEMNAVLGFSDKQDFRELLLSQVKSEHPDLDVTSVLDFNLSFYDAQKPAQIGLNKEFIASARLDNLLSTYIAAEALLNSDSDQSCILICNDHEEIGSRSEVGAQGTMLNDLMCRLVAEDDARQQALRKSLLFSIDNAHALHPNYADKHDGNHGPVLNQGPVLKFNANQAYATSSETSAFVRWLAKAAGETEIPMQSFAMRADMACGSTIGPITASNVGIKTVDIGVPQFAMHSIRELAAAGDVQHMRNLVDRFLKVEEIKI